jgi:hypothetical protein
MNNMLLLAVAFAALAVPASASASREGGNVRFTTPTCQKQENGSNPAGQVDLSGSGLVFDRNASSGAKPVETEEQAPVVNPTPITLVPVPKKVQERAPVVNPTPITLVPVPKKPATKDTDHASHDSCP